VFRLDGAERLPRVRAPPPVDRLVVVADEAHLAHAGPRADEPGLGDGEVLGFVDPDFPRLVRRRGGVQVGEPVDEVGEVPQLVGRFVACPRGVEGHEPGVPLVAWCAAGPRHVERLDPVRLPPLVWERFACEPLGPARHLRRGPVVAVALGLRRVVEGDHTPVGVVELDEGRPVADAVGDGSEGETVERAPSPLGQLAAGAELLGGGAREGERHEPIGWQPPDGDRFVDLAGDGGRFAGAGRPDQRGEGHVRPGSGSAPLSDCGHSMGSVGRAVVPGAHHLNRLGFAAVSRSGRDALAHPLWYALTAASARHPAPRRDAPASSASVIVVAAKYPRA
jgi:hypothetical protein